MTTWTRSELTYETMVRQGLSSRRPLVVTDAVESAMALQAQEPAAPYVALWNRVDGFDANDLDRAFATGDVVKMSLFRFTLHAVSASDVSWARAAMNTRAVDAGYHGVLTRHGLTEIDELLEQLWTTSDPHDTARLEQALSERVAGDVDHAALSTALRAIGAIRHAPTSGPWSFGRRPAFLPCTIAAATDEHAATAQLVRRYLAAFGPATVADIAQFTILKRSTLQAAVRSMDDLVTVAGPDGRPLLDVHDRAPGAGAAVATLPPRLLGMWDSVLLAYADRSRVIPEQHRPHVIRKNGDVLPTVVVHGLVRGVWRAAAGAIEVRAFEPIDDTTLAQLDDEARELRRLVAEREPEVFSRVGRWWDSLPDGPTITIGS